MYHIFIFTCSFPFNALHILHTISNTNIPSWRRIHRYTITLLEPAPVYNRHFFRKPSNMFLLKSYCWNYIIWKRRKPNEHNCSVEIRFPPEKIHVSCNTVVQIKYYSKTKRIKNQQKNITVIQWMFTCGYVAQPVFVS